MLIAPLNIDQIRIYLSARTISQPVKAALERVVQMKTELDAIAREIGLDASAFAACRGSAAVRARVEADRNDGIARGVDSTPTIFVGKRKVIGAQPIEVFRAEIDAARPR